MPVIITKIIIKKTHTHGNINKTGLSKAVLARKLKKIYRIKRKIVTVERS